MLHHGIILILLSFLLSATGVYAQGTFKVHADLPVVKGDQLLLDVFYDNDSSFRGQLVVSFYKFEPSGDSLLVLDRLSRNVLFKKGTNKTKVTFNNTDSNTSFDQKFYEVLKRVGNMPPGSYKAIISTKKKEKTYQSVYLYEIDSLLGPNSPMTQDINRSLLPKTKSFLGIRLNSNINKNTRTTNALSNGRNRIDKAAKKRGLATVHEEKDGTNRIDLYYQDCFAGRYEANKNEPLEKHIEKQNKLTNPLNINSLVSNDLGEPSLFSQYKHQQQNKRDQAETKGEIGFTTNVSSSQEQYSGVDNNYYELRGSIEIPVNNIPIVVEGLYTSQDNHRQIKSSYFRVHYNVEKVKEGLNKSLRSYNTKFAETKSKSAGIMQIYRSAIGNLEGQRKKLQKEIDAETDIKDLGSADMDTAAITNKLTGEADSNKVATKGKNTKKSLTDKQKKIEAKQKQLEELNKRIQKYNTLITQYENTSYFDSLAGYSKTKDINNYSDLSYKQMAKKGDNLLPDGKVKSFISGITSLDAGMFSKNESKYTMSGQQLKGIDVGYDLGFCQAGVTVGRTEYVGRDGTLDKYTCYSEKTSFTLFENQKLSLLYYGYSPDRKYYSDGFFKNAGISAPGFYQPVHIFSLNYDGQISKYVTIGGEAAISQKKSDKKNVPKPSTEDKMAYHFICEGNIPNTGISLNGSYDKVGGHFENNTLPVSMSGTEQFKLGARSDFFRSRLIAGIDYSRLSQSNFSSKGTSAKWGFDIRTNFKRYPNLALSYKPFTTFRSFTDTLNVPQRPLLGSVWTGKATYQVKEGDRSLRFLCLYNRSRTEMDTAEYGSTLLQFSVIYMDKVLTSSVSIGNSRMSGNDVALTSIDRSNISFLSLSAGYILNKKLTISGGQDFGVAGFGFSRFGMNGGFIYYPDKMPVSLRLNMRYNTYKLNSNEDWKNMYSGTIDVLYRFKTVKGKKNF